MKGVYSAVYKRQKISTVVDTFEYTINFNVYKRQKISTVVDRDLDSVIKENVYKRQKISTVVDLPHVAQQ